jgi:hypothetical protein
MLTLQRTYALADILENVYHQLVGRMQLACHELYSPDLDTEYPTDSFDHS